MFHYLGIKTFNGIRTHQPNKFRTNFVHLNILFITFLSWLLFYTLTNWPYGANHTNFNTFVMILILLIYSLNLINHKKIELNLIENKRYLFGALVILYYSAALHKMNFDFYHPEKSCTTWYHIKLLSRFFSNVNANDLPYFVKILSPQIVGSIELLAPTLLLFRNLRTYGIYLLIFLHSYLALGGFSDFSSLGMSILFLGFPIAQLNIKEWISGINMHFLSSYFIIVVCLVGAFIFPEQKQTLQTLQGLILIIVTINLLLNSNPRKIAFNNFSRFKFNFEEALKYIPLTFLIFFGTSIYFGYRSAGNFTMFSNLKLAGGFNNHFFMNKFDLFGYENKLFQIIKASDESMFAEVRQPLDWITKSGIDLAFHRTIELKKLDSFFLRVKDQSGNTFELNKNNIRDFLGPERSWFFYKTYMYSFVPDPQNINSCRW